MATHSNKNEGRNYGIEILRVVAMFYVVIIHALAQGGVLDNLQGGNATSYTAWFLFALGSCSVDIFGLITGYVMYSEIARPIRVSRYIQLWLQVVFYGLAVNLVFIFFHRVSFTKEDFLRALFPVFFNEYWYFSAYVGVILLSPVINAGLRSISRGTAVKMFFLLGAGFSCYGLIDADPFRLGGGQSVLWLVVMYCMGGIIKKCNIGAKINLYVGMVLIGGLAVITVFFNSINENFIRYDVSFTLLGQALLYVIVFSKIKIPQKMVYIIEFASFSAFSVYLLNCHPFVFEQINSGRFAFLAEERAYLMAAVIIAWSVVFVVASILIDKIRELLFRVLHIRQLTERVDAVVLADIR